MTAQTLPDDFGSTLKIALVDENFAHNSPNYHVNMDVWHERHVDHTCKTSVCLAGSVMANTFKVDCTAHAGPSVVGNLHDVHALKSLDKIRVGKFTQAAQEFHQFDPFLLFGVERPSELPRDEAVLELMRMRLDMLRNQTFGSDSGSNIPPPETHWYAPVRAALDQRAYRAAVRQQAELDRMRRDAEQMQIEALREQTLRAQATQRDTMIQMPPAQPQADPQVIELVERIKASNEVLLKCFGGSAERLGVTLHHRDRPRWRKDMEYIRDVCLEHAV